MWLADWGIEGDTRCHGDTVYALKTEQFPNPEQNDGACLLFLFPIICIYFFISKVFSGGPNICLNHFTKFTPSSWPNDRFVKTWSTNEMGSVAMTCQMLVCKVPHILQLKSFRGAVKVISCLGGRPLPFLDGTASSTRDESSLWSHSKWKVPFLPSLRPGHLSPSLSGPRDWVQACLLH